MSSQNMLNAIQLLESDIIDLMSRASALVGEPSFEELPEEFNFREKLSASDIRREMMIAILYATKLFLNDIFGADVSAKVIDHISVDFVNECLHGNVGEFKTLSSLIDNRFGRYERARKDPYATDEEKRSQMIGIVAACSLGLESNSDERAEFAIFVGEKVDFWRSTLEEEFDSSCYLN